MGDKKKADFKTKLSNNGVKLLATQGVNIENNGGLCPRCEFRGVENNLTLDVTADALIVKKILFFKLRFGIGAEFQYCNDCGYLHIVIKQDNIDDIILVETPIKK